MPSYSGVWNLVAVYQAVAQGQWTNNLISGQIGLFAGGFSGSPVSNINYITISTLGNSTNFGNLTLARMYFSGCSSSTRGVFGGGSSTGSSSANVNNIDFVTISSRGNAAIFGALTLARGGVSACSSSTRGVFAGGANVSGQAQNVIDYVTIASVGNAIDFGDLVVVTGSFSQGPAACSSPTRGVVAGGRDSSTAVATINFVTIATVGNASNFGNLSPGRYMLSSCSSPTRGLFAGGNDGIVGFINNIQFITIATTGNSSNFGDLTVASGDGAGCSSSTRGVFALSSSFNNALEYVTIATTGNALDFGDLPSSFLGLAACSNAHGGL